MYTYTPGTDRTLQFDNITLSGTYEDSGGCIEVTPPSPPFGVSYLGNDDNSSDLTTYSFTSQPLGNADAARYIIVAVNGHRGDAANRVLNSASIAGVSASIVVQATHSPGSSSAVSAIIIAAVPTGTTGTISLTFSGIMHAASVGVYRTVNLPSATPYATATDNTPSSGVVNPNVNTPGNGLVIAASSQRNGGTVTFNGVTKNFDVDSRTSDYVAAGMAYPVAASTPRAITITSSDTSPDNMVGVAASWSP